MNLDKMLDSYLCKQQLTLIIDRSTDVVTWKIVIILSMLTNLFMNIKKKNK